MQYKLNNNFISQHVGDKLIIFNSERSILYTLNETATCILMSFKKNQENRVIIEKVTKEFDVSLEIAKKDFNECIKDFIKKEIIIKK